MLPIQDQYQDQSQRQVATAHLTQTMSLLVLPNDDLRDEVLKELDRNPALELVERPVCPRCKTPASAEQPCPRCSEPAPDDAPVVFLSARESNRVYRGSAGADEDEMLPDPAAPEDLEEHVLAQLAPDLEASHREIAAYILSSLDEDGFLQDPPAILARNLHTTLSEIGAVLDLISHVDPPGLATSGPRQALLVQLDNLAHSEETIELLRQILDESFKELATRDFDTIARRHGITPSRARQLAEIIQDNLNPYPARLYWSTGRHPAPADRNVYYSPDVKITTSGSNGTESLVVEIFSPMTGSLRVNPEFRATQRSLNGEASEEWARHLERAELFVKCMQQRGNTMQRLMQSLASLQKRFILEGDKFLKPITRAQLAKSLQLHESTISRAVSGKSVQLPEGRVIPLSLFFERNLPVRKRIREIVDDETRPLTDQQISRKLKKEGIDIARRTVAKYRAMEKILPARLRARTP